MHQTAQRAFIALAAACLMAMLLLSGGPARAEGQPAARILQPQALNDAGVYELRQMDPNLTGLGARIAVICRSLTYMEGEPQNDYRPNIDHNCFTGRQITFHDHATLPAGISPHSTATCSILFGEDPDAYHPDLGRFYYQGAAPQVQADIYEFWHFLTDNAFLHASPQADIVTASFGNEFDDWWTRAIESLAEHYGLIVIAGIGNGSDAYDTPLYPGASANIIGVGVVDSVNSGDLGTDLSHFALAYPQHSSFGPTEDGRCKPDLVAPGNCLAAGADDPSRYEPTGNWSSFSTPLVAGTVALLVQKAKQDPDLSLAISPQAGNCVIKAILLNSATKLPFWHKGRLHTDDDHVVPLDYVQGAGMLNATAAYKQLVAGRTKPGSISAVGWDLNALHVRNKPRAVYGMTVDEPDNKFLTVTAVWNRHYEKDYPFDPVSEKDTNLRLELWAVDPDNPDNDYLLDYSDSTVDNVEHIHCRAAAGCRYYQIILAYSDSSKRLAQPYGLAWSVRPANDADNILWYDLNADGIVNKADFGILATNWLTSIKAPERYLLGDINSDGAINVKDVELLAARISRKASWDLE
jgi:hypothetical protein